MSTNNNFITIWDIQWNGLAVVIGAYRKKILWGVEMLRSRITLNTEKELHINLYILDNVYLIKLEFWLLGGFFNKPVILQVHSIFKDYFKA